MSRAVAVLERQAKIETPVKTGNLRRTITSHVEAGGNRGIVGTNARYARAVHDGTKPREIRPVRAKALFWKGAKHPVKRVRHPGTKGNPFLERALRASQGTIERELSAYGNKVLGSVK